LTYADLSPAAIEQTKRIILDLIGCALGAARAEPAAIARAVALDVTADHSLPFTTAVALMEGNLAIRHYDELYYMRPDVRALMQKISISVGDAPSNAWPEAPLCLLELETNAGEMIRARAEYHLGHPRNPMSAADQDAKLRAMAREYAGLADARIDQLIDRLRHLEEVDDVGTILALTSAV
jgi:2-methylcitrate dehydratase